VILNPDFDFFENEPDFAGEFVDVLLKLLFDLFERLLGVVRDGHSDGDSSLVEDEVEMVRKVV
jgi:hypothetical protein